MGKREERCSLLACQTEGTAGGCIAGGCTARSEREIGSYTRVEERDSVSQSWAPLDFSPPGVALARPPLQVFLVSCVEAAVQSAVSEASAAFFNCQVPGRSAASVRARDPTTREERDVGLARRLAAEPAGATLLVTSTERVRKCRRT